MPTEINPETSDGAETDAPKVCKFDREPDFLRVIFEIFFWAFIELY